MHKIFAVRFCSCFAKDVLCASCSLGILVSARGQRTESTGPSKITTFCYNIYTNLILFVIGLDEISLYARSL